MTKQELIGGKMSWRKVKLGDVCTIEKGKIGITKAVPGDFPLVVLGEERKSHNEFHFDGKAVIIPLVSSTGHGHRSLKRIHYEEGKFAVGDILCAVMPKNYNELDSMFLYRYLDVNKEKELVGRMKGMANVSLPIKSLAEIEIPLPSLHEQKTIIEKLSTINNQTTLLTVELTSQLDLVKQLRQAFLREAMQGKLVSQDPMDEPASELLQKIKAALRQAQGDKKGKKQKELPPVKEDEIPFGIPESWAWCRLGEIANNVEYGTSEKGVLDSNGAPVLRMNNIQDGKVVLENLKYVKETIDDLPALFLKYGDLLFNRTNSFELVGKAGVYKGNSNTVTFASYLIRVQFLELVSSEFINYYINSSLCRETQIEPDIIQQNGQANFNGTKLKNIIVPLPPLSEQHRIVAKLEQLMQLCDDLEQSIRQSKEQTNMLLQAALRESLQPNSFSLTPQEIAVAEGKG